VSLIFQENALNTGTKVFIIVISNSET